MPQQILIMGEPIKKRSRKGIGKCGTPKCTNDRIEGRYFCAPCSENMDRIRKEFEDDPNLLYNQRSDNPNRVSREKDSKGKHKKQKSIPTCCKIGCFEHRVPPSPYCDAHQDEQIYD